MQSPQSKEVERKRLRRLRVLQALQLNYPNPTTERMISAHLLEEDEFGYSKNDIRAELDYLGELGLIRLEREADGQACVVWVAKLMPKGVDFLDGLGPEYDGISRT